MCPFWSASSFVEEYYRHVCVWLPTYLTTAVGITSQSEPGHALAYKIVMGDTLSLRPAGPQRATTATKASSLCILARYSACVIIWFCVPHRLWGSHRVSIAVQGTRTHGRGTASTARETRLKYASSRTAGCQAPRNTNQYTDAARTLDGAEWMQNNNPKAHRRTR